MLLDAAEREALLSSAPKRVADPIRRLSRYPEETAGALMDPNPPAAPEDLTVNQTRELLGQWSSHTRGYIYVVSRDESAGGADRDR